MSRIVVLGGDGFVGSSFVNLQRRFPELTIVSRVPTSTGGHEIILNDVRTMDPAVFQGVDLVFNCLGIAHRRDSSNKELFYEVNRDLSLHLARVAKAEGVRKFVQMSSIAVYGDAQAIDISSRVQPLTHYGKSKAEADAGLLDLQDGRFSVLILRPPMIFGNGAPGNMGRLIRLVKALPVLPFENATEPREFLYIGNFVTLAEFAMLSGRSGVVLLKDLRRFSTRELIEIILDSLHIGKKMVRFPLMKVLEKLAPANYNRLFAGLDIRSNLTYPDDGTLVFHDMAKALGEMVRHHESQGHSRRG